MPRTPATYDVQVAGVKLFAIPVKYMVDDVGEGELLSPGVSETVPLGLKEPEDSSPTGSTPYSAVDDPLGCEEPPVTVGFAVSAGSVVNPIEVLDGWDCVPVPVLVSIPVVVVVLVVVPVVVSVSVAVPLPEPPPSLSSLVEDGILVESDLVVVAAVSVFPPDPVVVVDALSVLVLCPFDEVSVEVDESPEPGDSTGSVSQ